VTNNAWKNMKPLMLHTRSTSLCLKNELKIFKSTEAYVKGRTTLKWLLLERTTLESMANEYNNRPIGFSSNTNSIKLVHLYEQNKGGQGRKSYF